MYIYVSNLKSDISKVCYTNCYINSSSTTLYRTCFYIELSSINLLKLNFISCFNYGETIYSSGTCYLYPGEHYCNGLNLSKNYTHSISISNFYPTFSSIYQYNNFLNCSSSSNHDLYFNYGGYQIDLDYSNFIGNNGKSYIVYYLSGLEYKLFIKYSIFISNLAITYLMFSSSHIQTARLCYIIHFGNWCSNFNNENCLIVSSYTKTFLLTHYSTYLYNTPNELGDLNVNYKPMSNTTFNTNNMYFSN